MSMSSTSSSSFLTSIISSRDKAIKFIRDIICSKEFQDENTDLMFYFKATEALIDTGNKLEASKILDMFVDNGYILSNGDISSPGIKEKSKKGDYNLFKGYINGWVCRASHKMGRYGLQDQLWKYIRTLSHPTNGGEITSGPAEGEKAITDIFSTANHGITALEVGDMEEAKKCARYILDTIDMQDGGSSFYLKRNAEGALIKEGFDQGESVLYKIDSTVGEQLYFFIGFPMVFLAKLYQLNKDEKLKAACRKIFGFFNSCPKERLSCAWSHKVALACSYMAAIFRDDHAYFETCKEIVESIIKLQDEKGCFNIPGLDEDSKIDQTAELVTWWTEIAINLSRAN